MAGRSWYHLCVCRGVHLQQQVPVVQLLTARYLRKGGSEAARQHPAAERCAGVRLTKAHGSQTHPQDDLLQLLLYRTTPGDVQPTLGTRCRRRGCAQSRGDGRARVPPGKGAILQSAKRSARHLREGCRNRPRGSIGGCE